MRERLIGALGGVTESEASARALRAYESGYEDGGEDEPVSGTLRRQGYRSSQLGGALRDFGGLDYGKVLNVAWKVFLSHPVAKRYLQIKRDYIVGRGVQPQTEDEDLQEILDDFWQTNKLRRRVKKFVLQLRLFGEQCYPAFVRETDGKVRIGYIDPAQIEEVITHPENCLEKWAVVIKRQDSATVEPWRLVRREQRVYRIIRPAESVVHEDETVTQPEHEGKLTTAEQVELEDWETGMLSDYGKSAYDGSCFYFSVNDVSNQERGYTDLMQVIDWLDQLDEVLFALGDRENYASYFSWDVTLEGANDEKVKQRAAEIRRKPPKKGSVNVHNDQETWAAVSPDLKQAGSVETEQALLTHSLGGLGLPRHWYGYGDDTNRATAEAQNTPTWRTMETDQDETRDMVLEMLAFVRDQAEIAGSWKPKEEQPTEITLAMPEMSSVDVKAIAQSSHLLAQALSVATQAQWMPDDKAAEVWAKLMAELGVEYQPAEMEFQPEQPAADGDEKKQPTPIEDEEEPPEGEEADVLKEVGAALAAGFREGGPRDWPGYP